MKNCYPVFGGAPSPESTNKSIGSCSKSATCSPQKNTSNVLGREFVDAPRSPTKHANGASNRGTIDNGNDFIGNDTIVSADKENVAGLSPQKCQEPCHERHSHVNNDRKALGQQDKDEDEMTLPGTFESTSASAINEDEESNDARVVDWGNVNVTVADGATVTADEMEETQAILTQVYATITKQTMLPGVGIPKQSLSIVISADKGIMATFTTDAWKKKPPHKQSKILDGVAKMLYASFKYVQLIVRSKSEMTSERKTLQKIAVQRKVGMFVLQYKKNLRRALKASLKQPAASKRSATVAGVPSSPSAPTSGVASMSSSTHKSSTSRVVSDQKRSSSSTNKSKRSATVAGVPSSPSAPTSGDASMSSSAHKSSTSSHVVSDMKRSSSTTSKSKRSATVAGITSTPSAPTSGVASMLSSTHKSTSSRVVSDMKRSSSTTNKSKRSATVAGVVSTINLTKDDTVSTKATTLKKKKKNLNHNHKSTTTTSAATKTTTSATASLAASTTTMKSAKKKMKTKSGVASAQKSKRSAPAAGVASTPSASISIETMLCSEVGPSASAPPPKKKRVSCNCPGGCKNGNCRCKQNGNQECDDNCGCTDCHNRPTKKNSSFSITSFLVRKN